MIAAALENRLEHTEFTEHPVFGLRMPVGCEGVPSEILNPRNTWNDKAVYDVMAQNLANQFVENFKAFESFTNEEICSGAPVLDAVGN
jgi:phosphoenolpyruvate carboxykinase (ATP)